MLRKWWQGIVSIGLFLAYTHDNWGWSMRRFPAVLTAAGAIIAFARSASAADIPLKAARPGIAPSVIGAQSDAQTVWARLNLRFVPFVRSY